MKDKLAAILEVLGVFVTGVMLARWIGRAFGIGSSGLRDLERGASPDYLALAATTAANLLLRYGIILALAFAVGWWHRRRKLAEYGVTTAGLPVRELLAIAVVLFSVGGLPARALLFARSYVPLGRGPEHWDVLATTHSLEFWIYMAVGSFGLVPIVEELFFRGYVQTRLGAAFGAPAAIVMSALLFMLSHRQYFIASALGAGMMASLLVSSLIGGYARHRFGTLIPGILAHAIGNLPIRGWVHAAVLAAMILVIVAARRPIAVHARELAGLLRSRGILPAALFSVIVAIGVLAIALLAPKALPLVGGLALATAIGIESRDRFR